MRNRFIAAALLAAGLAGCAGATKTPTPTMVGNDKEVPLPPGQGMFGEGFTWRWGGDASVTPASAAEQEEFKKWRESTGVTDRQEFDDWRAWQEWKKKNPK